MPLPIRDDGSHGAALRRRLATIPPWRSAPPPRRPPGGLSGERVAFLWDYLFRGDEIFPALKRELTHRFPDIEIVGYDEFGNTHGGDEAEMIAGLPDALARGTSTPSCRAWGVEAAARPP